MGLWYPKDSGFELIAYSDADHAGCKDDCKSTSKGLQFLGGKLVSWSSKKQDCTAMSTAEDDMLSLSACCDQVIWIDVLEMIITIFKDDDIMKNTLNSGRNQNKVFRIVVPMTLFTSRLSLPNGKLRTSSAPRKSARLTLPVPVPSAEKADEMILQDMIQHWKVRKFEKLVEDPENVDDSSPPRHDDTSIPGTSNIVPPVNVDDEEDEITDEVFELRRRVKGKNVEETRIYFPSPIYSRSSFLNAGRMLAQISSQIQNAIGNDDSSLVLMHLKKFLYFSASTKEYYLLVQSCQRRSDGFSTISDQSRPFVLVEGNSDQMRKMGDVREWEDHLDQEGNAQNNRPLGGDVRGKEEDVRLDELGEGSKEVVSKIGEFGGDIGSELLRDRGGEVLFGGGKCGKGGGL
ncbi:hypothetical protein Tco_0111462 [Tanacetum coccineum]